MAKKTSKRASPSPGAPSPLDAPADAALPFEDLLGRLESLVGTLEEGDLPLEDSLTAYEQGVSIVRQAQHRLDAMDARLEELLQNGSTARFSLEGADDDDGDENDGDEIDGDEIDGDENDGDKGAQL